MAKSKDNPYTKPRVGKCYMCDEPGHRSNERPKRRPINIVDYEEEEDDALIEIKPEDLDFIKEHDDPIACVI